MRIVHVCTAWPRWPDDPITPWLVELVRRQRAAGHDARVLAPAWRGGPREETSGVPVRRFRYAPAPLETLTHAESVPDRLRRRPAATLLLPLYLAGGLAEAWATARAETPDVTHVHWPMPHALFGAALRRAAPACALVCSYYSVEIRWVQSRLPLLEPFLRWTARTADGLTAISRSTAAAVRELAGREAAVIPYGAAVGGSGGEGREPFAGDPDRPLEILFVGRLVERKGVEVAVRALARVRERRPARLTVVGEGERADSIRAEVERLGLGDAVHLTGGLPDGALVERYRTADVLVLPAVVDARGDTEGLGVVLLEALGWERPVVASSAGGIPDIVEHERTGWLVPPGDADALAERLLWLAAHPEEARRVARQGRELTAARFGWEGILESTEAAYAEARARRRRAAG